MDTTLFRVSGKGKRFWKGAGRSQGVVEFALAAPILLMLLFAIIDFSLLFSAWLLIQNVSRQALRYGITGQFNPAYCPNTDTTSWYYLEHQGEEDPYHNGLGPCVSGLTDTAANQAEVSEMQDIARIPVDPRRSRPLLNRPAAGQQRDPVRTGLPECDRLLRPHAQPRWNRTYQICHHHRPDRYDHLFRLHCAHDGRGTGRRRRAG